MLSWIFLCCFAAATPAPSSISHLKDIPNRQLPRIIGGFQASKGEFPWQASLQQSGRHFCGASLITRTHLMSAAHCWSNFVDVVLGAVDYRYGEQTIRATEFIRHPYYNSATIDFDYGIVRLSSAATLGGNVNTVELVAAKKEYSGTGTVSGWGYLQYGLPTPHNLFKADVPLVSQEKCQQAWGSRIEITDQMQCIGGDNKVTICMGDSGGPLTVQDNGQTILIGAASWTEDTCKPSLPGAFAKLSAVRSWIQSIANI